jgi:tRNA threonylcarbamoyladenosine modification (KEOPS) complex  Pcc1 subunit
MRAHVSHFEIDASDLVRKLKARDLSSLRSFIQFVYNFKGFARNFARPLYFRYTPSRLRS